MKGENAPLILPADSNALLPPKPTVTTEELRNWAIIRGVKEGERLGMGEAWTQVGKRTGGPGVLLDLLDYLDQREIEKGVRP